MPRSSRPPAEVLYQLLCGTQPPPLVELGLPLPQFSESATTQEVLDDFKALVEAFVGGAGDRLAQGELVRQLSLMKQVLMSR
jgi:hypothetical protein